MSTFEITKDTSTLDYTNITKDGDGVPIVKNSTSVHISVEIQDTAHLTENKKNVETSFHCPILTDCVTNGFKLPENMDDETMDLVFEYLIDDDSYLSTYFENNKQKLAEMSSVSIFPPEVQDNLEACLIACIFSLIAFMIDDITDGGSLEDPGSPTLNEKGLLALIDMYIAIMDNKPLEKYEKNLEIHVQNPKTMEVFDSIFKITKKSKNLFEEISSLYLDGQKRNYYLSSIRNGLLALIWHYKFPIKAYSYSDDMMFALRKTTAGIAPFIEQCALCLNIDLEENIRCEPIFTRVMEASWLICGIVNDVFSFSKELADEASENIILNKCRQGYKIEEAFSFGVEKLQQEYKNYSIFSSRIREMHAKNLNLQKYLDLSDHMVNIALPFHIQNPRYKKTKCWINGILMNPEGYVTP